MSIRVQVILDEQEREIFRWHALREGLSLSAWLTLIPNLTRETWSSWLFANGERSSN